MDNIINLKKELQRKAIHLSSLWIPIAGCCLEKTTFLTILWAASFIVLTADIGRHYIYSLNKLFNLCFASILREHEKDSKRISLTGSSYMMLSALITFSLFPKDVAVLAFAVLIISDALAAIIGKKFGNTPLLGKSLEGTLAFLLSGFLIATFIGYLYNLGLKQIAIFYSAVIVGAVMELFSPRLKLDDNLTIPLTMALFIKLINYGIA